MKFRALVILIVVAVNLPWSAGAFTREELVCPVREDWVEGSDECPCEYGWYPTQKQLREILDSHRSWTNKLEIQEPPVPGQAILCRANLYESTRQGWIQQEANPEAGSHVITNFEGVGLLGANLENADLLGQDLKGAILSRANLNGAILYTADLSDADLYEASLENAYLSEANLSNAHLYAANLDNADLSHTDLKGANLVNVYLKNSNLQGANLSHATYAPASGPPHGYLEGINGLARTFFFVPA